MIHEYVEYFCVVKDYVDNIKQILDSSGTLSFGVLALQLFDNRKDKRYYFTQIVKFTIALYQTLETITCVFSRWIND